MPRKSSAELTTITPGPAPHMAPPERLTEQSQKDRWNAIVRTKPADWFTADNEYMLVELIRAIETADQCDKLVNQSLESGDMDAVKEATAIRDRESKRVAQLSTKLRLTNQARYTTQRAGRVNKDTGHGSKPWERSG